MTPKIQRVTLPTGIAVEYIESGSLTGTPLLLLHGLSDSWHSFLPLLPHLPENIRVLAFSQRGHGQSSKPRSGYGLASLAADAAAFLDAMHIERAVVAGHSMGAAVATMLAASRPKKLTGLALLGAFANFRGNADIAQLRREIEDLTDPIDRDFVHAFQVSTVARMVDDDFIDLVVNDSQSLPSFAWRALADGFLATDLMIAFGRIEVPTRLIWGDQDLFVPRSDQDAMLSAMPAARLHVLQDAGHAVHWDRPGETASILGSLMRSIAGRMVEDVPT